MIEQIHVTIPHFLYHASYASNYANSVLDGNNNISESAIIKFGDNIVEKVYKICGSFQTYNYHSLYLSTDNKNMKTIPIKKDKNKWKLN